MKKTNQKRARIIYNEEFDSFDVEIMTEEGWGLDQRYKCQARLGGNESQTNFIHFGILRKIADLNYQGYKVEMLK